jgi:lipopolysaccharide transport system ATP-binding protein
MSLYVIEDARLSLSLEKDIVIFNVQEGERKIGSWVGREPSFKKP